MSNEKKKRIYLICPVRQCTPEQKKEIDQYVEALETQGHWVHYPPRDVDQTNDDGGLRICREHRTAMLTCNEVHVWWDPRSTGSHFDLGMAFMLQEILLILRILGISQERSLRIVSANEIPDEVEKSFSSVLRGIIFEQE